MFNAFICVKEKGNPFFKMVVEKVIDNILHKTSFQSDLYITVPGVLGECVSQYFNINRPYFDGEYLFEGLKIKILNHSIDLSIPKGSWKDSAKNYYVKDNTLFAECRNSSGKWIKNSVKFNVGDDIINNNGNLNNNSNIEYSPCDGSTILYDNNEEDYDENDCAPTLGFRGEALFCLANLSRSLVVSTRTIDEDSNDNIFEKT